MYEQYWQFDRRPFESNLEERFYYPSETHQGAILKLRYAVENGADAALLAGPSGSGKSLLVHTLRRQLSGDFAPFVHVVFPQMNTVELLTYLADELGATREGLEGRTVDQAVRRIQRTLAENTTAGRHAVLVVDEAHLLADTPTLESLRLLLNFDLAARSGLTLLLVGQPTLLPALSRIPQLDDRLGVKTLIRPFTLEETTAYVQHRLNAAGATREIFDLDALETVHNLTHGVARRINRLCDLALLIGYAEQLDRIAAAHVESVSDELVTVAPE
jgi:general secretion pathway protein A